MWVFAKYWFPQASTKDLLKKCQGWYFFAGREHRSLNEACRPRRGSEAYGSRSSRLCGSCVEQSSCQYSKSECQFYILGFHWKRFGCRMTFIWYPLRSGTLQGSKWMDVCSWYVPFFFPFCNWQAVVLCQVERAREAMLNQLYSSVRYDFDHNRVSSSFPWMRLFFSRNAE